MKKLVTALFLFYMVAAAAAADRKSYPMTVPAAGVESISFNLQEGDFVLRGDPAAREVRMQVSIDRTWIFKLGEEQILKRLIKVSGEGSRELSIATDIPRSVLNWGRAQYPIDFEVVVPAGARLNIRDTSGKIVVEDMQADVQVHDGSGTLAVRSVGGKLDVQKESGDIHIAEVQGPTTIRSESGQMQLEQLGPLQIMRSSGNLQIRDTGATRVRNASGNVAIQDVKGDLVVEDDSGEIVIANVEGSVTIHDTSGQIRTRRTGAVTVHDTSGDLTVEQATSLTVMDKESGQVVAKDVGGQVQAPPGIKIKSGM